MPELDRWRGRVALVTGASSGIGEVIARRLAETGLRVAALARRGDRLEALAAGGAGEIAPFAVDATDDDAVLGAFDQIRRRWGGVDVLVNNAGIASMGPLAEGEPQQWRDSLSINVAAPALFIREALRDMADRDEGQIINLSSIYAHRDQVPSFAFYQASKFAIRALTNTLRAEIAAAAAGAGAPARIRVGMISPGMVATEFRERATGGAFTYESYFEQFEPLMPSDVADAVIYMLSTPPHVQIQDILLSPMGQAL